MSACRGPITNDADVPCIHVRYVCGQVDAVEHAPYGIEEERVPWALAAVADADTVSLARDARERIAAEDRGGNQCIWSDYAPSQAASGGRAAVRP